MRADPSKNMGFIFGTDEYKAKKKIVQAPGGASSISLGSDNSSPFEHRKPRQLKVEQYNQGTMGYQQQNTYFDNQRVTPIYARDNQSNFSSRNNLRQPVYTNPEPDMLGRAYQTNYEELLNKDWRNPSNNNLFQKTQDIRSPLELAYMKQKANESDTYKFGEPQNYQSNFHTAQYDSLIKPNIRSRSQVSSIQNNYKNILNDFSQKPNTLEAPYSPKFRTSIEFSEDQSQKVGKKIMQPPGGASSFKFWN